MLTRAFSVTLLPWSEPPPTVKALTVGSRSAVADVSPAHQLDANGGRACRRGARAVRLEIERAGVDRRAVVDVRGDGAVGRRLEVEDREPDRRDGRVRVVDSGGRRLRRSQRCGAGTEV